MNSSSPPHVAGKSGMAWPSSHAWNSGGSTGVAGGRFFRTGTRVFWPAAWALLLLRRTSRRRRMMARDRSAAAITSGEARLSVSGVCELAGGVLSWASPCKTARPSSTASDACWSRTGGSRKVLVSRPRTRCEIWSTERRMRAMGFSGTSPGKGPNVSDSQARMTRQLE